MGADKKPDYFPQEIETKDCGLAVRRGDGTHTCGIQYNRRCDGKISGRKSGNNYKCKTTGFDIELR